MPYTKVPSKDLWVSVKPADSIDDRVENLSKALKDVSTPKSAKGSCWHPIYGGDPQQTLQTASLLKLLNTDANLNCQIDQRMAVSKDALDYIYLAISSETEFVVSNGNAKLLRLPKGRYEYTIERHSKLPESLSVGTVGNAQGNFKWSRRRPSVVVRKW
jgi:hypothetical protein